MLTPLHLITALAASATAGSLIAQVRMAGGQNMADSTAFSSASQKPSAPAAVPQQQSAESMLVERICAGEKELFYELVRPYERAIYVAAFSVLHNEHDAEEVAQEAVLKAFTHLARFRGDAKFSTWIIQI